MRFNSSKFSSLKVEHLVTASIYVSAAVSSEELEFLADDSSYLSHTPCLMISVPLHVLSFCLMKGP